MSPKIVETVVDMAIRRGRFVVEVHIDRRYKEHAERFAEDLKAIAEKEIGFLEGAAGAQIDAIEDKKREN